MPETTANEIKTYTRINYIKIKSIGKRLKTEKNQRILRSLILTWNCRLNCK